MTDPLSKPCTAFKGFVAVASGALIDVALEVKALLAREPGAAVLTFDDTKGEVIDLDLRGTTAEMVLRLTERVKPESPSCQRDNEAENTSAGARGRPKLGVIAREVTLLPRHWEWLASQRGGASQALRRLVEEARRADGGRTRAREAQESCYRFISAMAGNFPGFEEASRALFAGDQDRFAEHAAAWPPDVRSYACKLAWGGTATGLEGGTTPALGQSC
jgi:hypothetical protein